MRDSARDGTLTVILAVAITVVATPWWNRVTKDTFVAYFANANGLYTGDEVRILGVAVGTIDAIDPQPNGTKVTFSVDREYPVPADVAGGDPVAVAGQRPGDPACPRLLRWAETGSRARSIPQDRTAVPVEWDDFRKQLEKLTESLQPTTPGGVSPVGEFINTAADNLRGQGDTARDTVIKLSQALSALGDHSTDIFSTVATCNCWCPRCPRAVICSPRSTRTSPTSRTVLSNTPNEVADATTESGRCGDRPVRLHRREPRRPRRHVRPTRPRSPRR